MNFVGATNNLAVNSDAMRVAVNCGSGSCTGQFSQTPTSYAFLESDARFWCTGSWDWSALKVTGGKAGPITNFSGIKNFSQ